MRATIVVLICLMSTSLLAQPKAKEKIIMSARVPPFVEPLTLEDSEGEIKIIDDNVCYDDISHEALLEYLFEVKPASDLRAFKAWSNGYTDGYASGARRAIKINEANKLKVTGFSDIIQSKLLWLTLGAVTYYLQQEFIK